MFTITIARKAPDQNCTMGLLGLNGIWECYTLEPSPPVTPPGRYTYTVGPSLKFGHNVIHVNDVPGHTGIEVHCGNTKIDTDGCTLVGRTEGNDFIGHSQEEFAALLAKIPNTGIIEYLNLFDPSSVNQEAT